MTSHPSVVRFGVDLITFFHPSFWGLASTDELSAKSHADPRWFWDKVLDSTAEAGIQDLELTFPPADYKTAISAYGGTAGFKAELADRGLGVVSGYFSGIESATNALDTTTWPQIIDSAREYAEFLSECGGQFLVTGLPMRKSRSERPARFVDLSYAGPIADLVNQVGAATLERGVQTALHTESHSIFWTPRDVDLFMMLTDPMYVAMCPDTGHIALAGADPAQLMQRHCERLVIAHWKDAIGPVPTGLTIDETIFDRQGQYFRRVGAGVIDWFAWSRLLRDIGYRGCTLLELDAVADPITEMTRAREYVQTALQQFYPNAVEHTEQRN